MRIRRLLTILVNIMLIAVMFAALLGVLVWLTGRLLSDRYEWSQWIAWTPTPVAVALAVIGFAAAWRPGGARIRKRVRRIGWGVAVIALIVYSCTIEHHLLSLRDCDVQGLRIAHWNSTAVPNDKSDAAAQYLIDRDADIVVLTNHGGLHRRPAARQWIADGEGIVLRPQPFAVFSRLRVLEARTVVSSEQMHIVILRLDASESIGRELTFWLIDLPSDPEVPRMETAQQVRQWLDESDLPDADIIVGDFNMTRGSASLDVIAPDHIHAFDAAGIGYAATYPRELPWLHIDHMLLADDIEPAAYCIIDPGVGTHRLQILTIEMQN